MHVRSRRAATQLRRSGLTSAVLLHPPDGDTALTVTWVAVEPGAAQPMHSHPQEQVYVIVEGTGRVTVGEETADVEAGTLVHIPGDAPHAVRNTGTGVLNYVSAATPPLALDAFYESRDVPGAM